MPVQSRKAAIGKGTDGTYHAFSRCLEHTVLDGIHPASGKKTTNRRGWVAQRVGELQSVFAVRVLAVTLRERRVDLVLTCLPEAAGKWSAEEVVWRWTSLFGHRFGSLDRHRFSELVAKKSLVAEWRNRLTSVSWFMRGFNEWLARRINKEEQRKGQFWDGRFRCERVGKADTAGLVAGLEGHRIAIPAARNPVLFPGTKALPEVAAPAKRQAKSRKRGPLGPRLTPDQKIEICRRLASGEKVKDLAEEYGRSSATISTLKKMKTGDTSTIAGSKLDEAERALLRKLALRQKPKRAKNGRFVYHPNDIHALAEKTFGRKLYYHPFEEFCRELRNS
jgi:hypothetical protein